MAEHPALICSVTIASAQRNVNPRGSRRHLQVELPLTVVGGWSRFPQPAQASSLPREYFSQPMFFQRILPIIPPNRSPRPHRSFAGSTEIRCSYCTCSNCTRSVSSAVRHELAVTISTSRLSSSKKNILSLPSTPLCCPPLSSRRDSSMVTCAWINILGKIVCRFGIVVC